MDYFVLHPNFEILRSYLGTNTDQQYDAMVREFEAWGNVVQSPSFSTIEKVEQLKEGFRELLSKFNLSCHYENLLYLTLHYYEVIHADYTSALKHHANKEFMLEEGYSEWVEYGEIQRAKELAGLLLFLKRSKADDLHIAFQAPKDSVRVKDSILSSWICDTLLDAIENSKSNLDSLGEKALHMLTSPNGGIDLARIQEAADAKIKNPKKVVSKLIAKFCLSLLPYLNNETHLKAVGVKYGDQQLKFLYDLLVLLKLLYVKLFEEQLFKANDYHPKDYIRSLLP
ncbi:hypothetical protein [Rubrolithibacter danxiaensis]|uniref:hypothetical protein n=1 Tax=Rubrolithibacter danxiaensis TaxID=3390805 RepID=UPI003BF88426